MTRFSAAISLYVLLGTGCVDSPASSGDGLSVADSLSVLTLNLHTYQEVHTDGVAESELTDAHAAARVANYAHIFDRIAAGINDLDADIVCLQEVG